MVPGTALYARDAIPRVQLSPQLHGVGMSRNALWYSIPQIVGFGSQNWHQQKQKTPDQLEAKIVATVESAEFILMVIPPKDSPATSTSVWRRGWSGATAGIAAGDGGVFWFSFVRNNCSFPCPHSTGTLGQLAYASVRFELNTAAEIDKVAQHAIIHIHSLQAVCTCIVFL